MNGDLLIFFHRPSALACLDTKLMKLKAKDERQSKGRRGREDIEYQRHFTLFCFQSPFERASDTHRWKLGWWDSKCIDIWLKLPCWLHLLRSNKVKGEMVACGNVKESFVVFSSILKQRDSCVLPFRPMSLGRGIPKSISRTTSLQFSKGGITRKKKAHLLTLPEFFTSLSSPFCQLS